jgi:hypothetical protein
MFLDLQIRIRGSRSHGPSEVTWRGHFGGIIYSSRKGDPGRAVIVLPEMTTLKRVGQGELV